MFTRPEREVDRVFLHCSASDNPEHDSIDTVQHLLSEAGHPLEEDGLFGQATLEAVRAFQRQHGLRPDGIVGPRTWSALTNGTPERPRSEASPRREEPQEAEDTQGPTRPSTRPSNLSQRRFDLESEFGALHRCCPVASFTTHNGRRALTM